VLVPVTTEPTPDGLRATDPTFQRLVEERVDREIRTKGIPALRLDPAARDRWLDVVEAAVIERLQPPQLALL
jgi:hypothetical protein